MRMSPANVQKHLAQHCHRAGEQVVAAPLQGIDHEEKGAAWMPGASSIGRAGIVPKGTIRRNALGLLRPTQLLMDLR
jgi:hypothetical protein